MLTRTDGNLYEDLPVAGSEEAFTALLARPGVHVSRIVSHGQASPAGFWYDQPHGEWVLLLAGAARLRFEDEAHDRVLAPGDHLDIAAHRRHRVQWTAPDTPTIWLALHYGNEPDVAASRRAAAPGDPR
jgi:cupin 2 domain-containing protein